jgi:hypothetical protein
MEMCRWMRSSIGQHLHRVCTRVRRYLAASLLTKSGAKVGPIAKIYSRGIRRSRQQLGKKNFSSRDSSSKMKSSHHTGSPLLHVSQLLDAFKRRNRNQHRRSPWWQQFDILQRSTRKLASDISTSSARWVADKVVPPCYTYLYPTSSPMSTQHRHVWQV